MSARPTVVLVAGLRGPVATHWQTWLGHRLDDRGEPNVTVPLLGREHIDLDERVAALDAVVRSVDGPVVLVAHSAGVITTVHWARRNPATARRVVGALLATPPDLVSPLGAEYPSLELLGEQGWTPVPVRLLPFPSIVAVSTTDDLADPQRVLSLALAWGSEVEVLGPVGHLNPACGFGPWPHGEDLLARLVEQGTYGAAEVAS